MKKKCAFLIISIVISVVAFASLGLNVYFLATKPLSASGIFSICKDSILEIKAQTENIGDSFGSGEIVSADGTVITNAHVIAYKNLGQTYTFSTISVRFVDEDFYRPAELIKYDLDLDIAVIKISNLDRKLKPITIGNSGKLESGDNVYAIGNMSNYGLSLTSGIVAIPNVNIAYNDMIRNVIQCDLTISEGNSGGALLNQKGELIGITTFRLKDNSNNIIYGISYCIPINTVMEYIGS